MAPASAIYKSGTIRFDYRKGRMTLIDDCFNHL